MIAYLTFPLILALTMFEVEMIFESQSAGGGDAFSRISREIYSLPPL